MKGLYLQIQPHRAPKLDLAAIRYQCEKLASNEAVIERFETAEGEDNGAYINLMFETRSAVALWALLQEKLYGDERLGSSLLRSSMAMCEGNQGWDDYLLLHHFDRTLKLDELPDD